MIEKHLFGYPNKKLKNTLANHSIFNTLIDKGYQPTFLNAFRPVFFTSPELFSNIPMSATTEMNRAAGLRFNSLKDIQNKKALYHDYTNEEVIKKGFKLKRYDEFLAASILIDQVQHFDLILYEYFLTDKAGHEQNLEDAISQVNKIESLIYQVAQNLDLSKHSLIVCSDHGNIEDIRTKSHSKNPAFFGIWTKSKIIKLQSLVDIHPMVLKIIQEKKPVLN